MSANAEGRPEGRQRTRSRGRSETQGTEAESSEARQREDLKLPDQVYKDEREASIFEPYHTRVRTEEPNWIYEIVRSATTLFALIAFRARCTGSENVPNGPVILAPNHASFYDHFLTGAFIRRHVQFMAKSHMFVPGKLKTWIYTHGGVFPVRRGSRDEDAVISAEAILGRGGCLGMYVEGGRTRTGEISAEAKPGMGRLALRTGVPVVPVAIIGSHQIRNWKRGHFPRVRVHYGAPLAFAQVDDPSRGQQQAAANEILRRITALHTAKSKPAALRPPRPAAPRD